MDLNKPGVLGNVTGAIRVEAYDRTGRRVEFSATGLPARVIQHETDHLDGTLVTPRFLDQGRDGDYKVISFNAKASADEREKHQNFVARMVAKGYTEKQVRLLAEWYLRVHKSS